MDPSNSQKNLTAVCTAGDWPVVFGSGQEVPNPLLNSQGSLNLRLELCLFGSWPNPESSYSDKGKQENETKQEQF